MVAAHPVGAVLGHCRALTVLGDAGRVLLGGMPELKTCDGPWRGAHAWGWKTPAASKS